MHVIPASNAGFLPYTPPGPGGGAATGPAVDHLARVVADGGQGLDQDATTALFNLFANQALPASLRTLCDPLLGYKLNASNEVVKIYSATGAAGDFTPVAGSGAVTLLANHLNGRTWFQFGGLMQLAGVALDSTAGFGLLSTFTFPATDERGPLSYVINDNSFLTVLRQYGTAFVDLNLSYGDRKVNFASAAFQRLTVDFKALRAPYELLVKNNGVTDQYGGGSIPAFSAANPFYWGGGQSYGYPSLGQNVNSGTMAVLTASDPATLDVLDAFFKSHYGMPS